MGKLLSNLYLVHWFKGKLPVYWDQMEPVSTKEGNLFIKERLTYLNMFTGKTTTISILTGLIQATSGKLAIYGYDIASDIHEIRQMTGIW